MAGCNDYICRKVTICTITILITETPDRSIAIYCRATQLFHPVRDIFGACMTYTNAGPGMYVYTA